MSLYITKEELALIWSDRHEEPLTDTVLDKAVDDYNGRLDNIADMLVEDIISGIEDGTYDD